MKIIKIAALIIATLMPVTAGAASSVFEANDRLSTVLELNKKEFVEARGILKRSWMWDEAAPRFVVTVGLVTYDVKLDDGRGTTKLAFLCKQQELFGNSNEGCSISFDGVYHVEQSGNSIEIDLTIWNVTFLD